MSLVKKCLKAIEECGFITCISESWEVLRFNFMSIVINMHERIMTREKYM